MNKEQRDAVAKRLRAQAQSLRRKPTPLVDLIPLLTEAADALSDAAPQEPCFCDRQGLGESGVSCGDCPTRDYKAAQPATPDAGLSARDRQIVELCARVLDQMAEEDNTSNYYVIAARRVRALKTEEVHLTARYGLPSEREQKQPDSVHLTRALAEPPKAQPPKIAGRIRIETATVYRGGRRRWFSLDAATRAEARALHRQRFHNDCMCSDAEPGPYGAPGETCQFHEPHFVERFTRRVARLIVAAEGGAQNCRSQSGAKKQDHPESESGGSISAIGRDASKENGNA